MIMNLLALLLALGSLSTLVWASSLNVQGDKSHSFTKRALVLFSFNVLSMYFKAMLISSLPLLFRSLSVLTTYLYQICPTFP